MVLNFSKMCAVLWTASLQKRAKKRCMKTAAEQCHREKSSLFVPKTWAQNVFPDASFLFVAIWYFHVQVSPSCQLSPWVSHPSICSKGPSPSLRYGELAASSYSQRMGHTQSRAWRPPCHHPDVGVCCTSYCRNSWWTHEGRIPNTLMLVAVPQMQSSSALLMTRSVPVLIVASNPCKLHPVAPALRGSLGKQSNSPCLTQTSSVASLLSLRSRYSKLFEDLKGLGQSELSLHSLFIQMAQDQN